MCANNKVNTGDSLITIKRISGIILTFLLFTGYVVCQSVDSSSTAIKESELPGWLTDKIKEMSIDEIHFGVARIFMYEIDSMNVYWIDNPLSSCRYCEIYHSDGRSLNPDELKVFMNEKGEPVLIWENHPAVRFDSLRQNIEH